MIYALIRTVLRFTTHSRFKVKACTKVVFFQVSSNPTISSFSWKHGHETDDEWNIIMNTFWQIIMMMLCGWMVAVVAHLMKMSVIIIEVRGLEEKLSTSGEICLTIIYHVETVSTLAPTTHVFFVFFQCWCHLNINANVHYMTHFAVFHSCHSAMKFNE